MAASSPPTDQISSLLSTARDLVNRKYFEDAAEVLQRVLVMEPANTVALSALAEICLRQKRPEEAWRFALSAFQALPNVPATMLLGRAAQAMGDLDRALGCYNAILTDFPNDPRALSGLADVYEEAGFRARAIVCHEKIQNTHPNHPDNLRRLAKLYSYDDAQKLLMLYDGARPDDSASDTKKIAFQSDFAVRKEYAERLKRGLAAQAISPDDLHFRFARDELALLEEICDEVLARAPTNRNALACKAMSVVARGDARSSEPHFQACAAVQPGSLYETVRFGEAFYRELQVLDEASLISGFLPVIDVLTPDFDDKPIMFLSCDIQYFVQFARPLLLSINDVASVSQVHVHIMHAMTSDLQAAGAFCASLKNIKVAISGEPPAPGVNDRQSARNYFHAVRFVRMLEFLLRYQKPLWLLDVDALLNRDPQPTFQSLDGADVVLFGFAGRLEPWFQFNASVVGIYPTLPGIKYLRMVAGYISHFHNRNQLRWGVDQMAMYGVFEFLKSAADSPIFKMLPPMVFDESYVAEGVVWGNGTAAKFSDIKKLLSLAGEAPDSPRIRYSHALQKYITRLT